MNDADFSFVEVYDVKCATLTKSPLQAYWNYTMDAFACICQICMICL